MCLSFKRISGFSNLKGNLWKIQENRQEGFMAHRYFSFLNRYLLITFVSHAMLYHLAVILFELLYESRGIAYFFLHFGSQIKSQR